MKLYSARAATEVALEAVQLFGGNGYMSEFQVEQLARDAKVLQIYAGTDEIQITHIAKDLLRSLDPLRPPEAMGSHGAGRPRRWVPHAGPTPHPRQAERRSPRDDSCRDDVGVDRAGVRCHRWSSCSVDARPDALDARINLMARRQGSACHLGPGLASAGSARPRSAGASAPGRGTAPHPGVYVLAGAPPTREQAAVGRGAGRRGRCARVPRVRGARPRRRAGCRSNP